MNIISERRSVIVVQYMLCYEWKDMPGAGFSFPCDEHGSLLLGKMPLPAQENLKKCMNGEFAVVSKGVKDCSYTYHEPAQLRCPCNRIVVLEDAMTNTCECGLEYNGGGQLLAPRSQWGDEWVTQPEEDYGLY